MRILMLDNEFPPLGGGTGVINYHVLRELELYEDVHVDLVTSSRARSGLEEEQFSPRIRVFKVPVNNKNIHHSSNRELITYAVQAFLLCRRLVRQNRYDLSLAFAGVPAGAVSLALKTLFGLPYLVSLQGPDVPGFEERYRALYPLLRPLIRRIWREAAVVTASSEAHRALAQHTAPGLPMSLVYNGVDTDAYCPTDIPPRDVPISVVCVGRLIDRKGQHHLVRAFAEVKQQCDRVGCLTLVGTGDAEASLRALVHELGLQNDVVFAGVVSREEMPEVYRTAHLFVLPSQNEGMSVALLEALASGLPAIVCDVGGTSELVSHGVNGLVCPWADVDELARQLIYLGNDSGMLQRMGAESRKVALRYSWRNVARRYLELMGPLMVAGDTLMCTEEAR